MALKRALTVQNILDKKYKLFDFTERWYEAFDKPEMVGVWFIWGNSGNGKTSFVIQLIKELVKFEKVHFCSLEEGTSHTLQKSFSNFSMNDMNNSDLHVVSETISELTERLKHKKSRRIVVIDSFQYTLMSYRDYLEFKQQFPDKLLIFISHADGKNPAGRSAKSVMYDASLKIYIEGYRAFSKGRYIGDTGYFDIWPEKAMKWYGQ